VHEIRNLPALQHATNIARVTATGLSGDERAGHRSLRLDVSGRRLLAVD